MGRVLDNHALGVKTRLRMELFRRFPVQEERPLRRTQHAGKKFYKGRFSCAVFPDKGDLLARMQGKIHTVIVWSVDSGISRLLPPPYGATLSPIPEFHPP